MILAQAEDTRIEPPEYKSTGIERNMYDALDWLGIQHEPQTEFGYYTVDTYISEYRVALEADGCCYHGCPVCPSGEYTIQEVTDHESRRFIRDERLYRRYGVITVHIVHIWGHSLLTQEDAINAVLTTLAPWLDW